MRFDAIRLLILKCVDGGREVGLMLRRDLSGEPGRKLGGKLGRNWNRDVGEERWRESGSERRLSSGWEGIAGVKEKIVKIRSRLGSGSWFGNSGEFLETLLLVVRTILAETTLNDSILETSLVFRKLCVRLRENISGRAARLALAVVMRRGFFAHSVRVERWWRGSADNI